MRWIATCLVASLSVAGAATAADTEQRLERVERRVELVTQMTLDLDRLRAENRELRGQVESLQYAMEQLKRKQRDIYADIDQRLSALQTPAPLGSGTTATLAPPVSEPKVDTAPQSVAAAPLSAAQAQQMQADYQAAYALLSPAQKRYGEAATAFGKFLTTYPQSSLAGNAQYWQAEAYYVAQQNDQALQAFDKVLKDYPDSPKAPGALYKIARLQIAKGDPAAARQALQQVINDYPNSSAVGLAADLLKTL